MFERISAILSKEFKQVFRDPRMKMIIFVSPLVQMFIFGYAATTDINNVPTALYDLDNTKETREIIHRFVFSGYFIPKYYISDDQQQRDLIDRADVNLVIRFNRGFAQDLNGNKSGRLQFILDGTDSNSAGIILNYATTIINNYNEQFLIKRYSQYGVGRVDLRDRAWFNDNLISRNYYLPGVIVMIVTIMSLLLSSMAIVREKEIGTMEQLIVSPIKPIELILGKLLPFGVIAIGQVTLIATVGILWFRIPIHGSLLLLFASTLIYLLTSLGIGLFISTLCSTQQEAMMSVFLFYFPTMLLSGFAYPIANMPTIIQYITIINPMRYFLVVVRGIFLKGVGMNVLWHQLLPLLCLGLIVITMSSLRFRKRLG